MTDLLLASNRRPYEQLRGWALNASESAVASEREALQIAVADRSGSVHIWPLEWRDMEDDQHALDYCRGELARRVRLVGGIAHALLLPGWIDDEGVLWAQPSSELPPRRAAQRIVVLSVACRDERSLLVGTVAAGPPRRVARWERVRALDAGALALGP